MTGPVIVSPKLIAEITDVKPATVRAWVHRGKITRQANGGIDVRELIHWLDARSPVALANRAGLKGDARSATDTRNNRAARLLAEALTMHRRMMLEDPNAVPDTPDNGEWLRKRRI